MNLFRFTLALCIVALAVPAGADAPVPSPQAEAKWQGIYAADPQVRRETVERMGAQGTVSAHVGLVDLLLGDPDESVRAAAATAIGQSRNGDLREPLAIAKQRDPSPWVRQAAGNAYVQLRPFWKTPRMAGGLALLPGVGHFYLGQHGKGAAYLSSIVGLTAGAIALSDSDAEAGDPLAVQFAVAAQNTLMYSVFDAYRTARLLRHNQDYKYEVSDESLGSLLLAPFTPSVLKSPWVWAGVPLMVAAGVGLSLALTDDATSDRTLFDPGGVNFLGRRFGRGTGFALGSGYFAALFAPVGVGEEALFRGVLLPSLSESFGVGWGLTLSSLLFGAAHIGNFSGATGYQYDKALFAVPFITLGGAYMGLVATRHNFTLARSVAIHFWYNFLLSTVDFVLNPDHQPFVARFGMPF